VDYTNKVMLKLIKRTYQDQLDIDKVIGELRIVLKVVRRKRVALKQIIKEKSYRFLGIVQNTKSYWIYSLTSLATTIASLTLSYIFKVYT